MHDTNGVQTMDSKPEKVRVISDSTQKSTSSSSVELTVSPHGAQSRTSESATNDQAEINPSQEWPCVTFKCDKHAKSHDVILAERRQFVDFASHDANPAHRQILADLYKSWWQENRRHFECRLIEPHITLGITPPRALGFCSKTTDWGSDLQITIDEKLVFGGHRLTAKPWPAEGLKKFVFDILLHEMIHQFQIEVRHETEPGHRGHGQIFTRKCNEIGESLGLPKVIIRRRGRKDDGKPVCNHWPHNVRPPGFYLPDVREAYIEKVKAKPRHEPDELQLFRNLLAFLDDRGLKAFRQLLLREIKLMERNRIGTTRDQDDMLSLSAAPIDVL